LNSLTQYVDDAPSFQSFKTMYTLWSKKYKTDHLYELSQTQTGVHSPNTR